MPSRTALATLAVALVLLAGCGGGPADGTTTATTELSATTDDQPTTTETAAQETTATLRSVDADAEAVREDVLAALDAVETYRVNATFHRTQTANGVTRNVTVESQSVFDRSARELRTRETTTGAGQSVSSTTYLVNGTLYQRSPQFVQAYSSQWVRVPVENVSERWRMLDTVTRQRWALSNASVSVLGGRTVDSTEAYVLEVDVDEAAYNRLLENRLAQPGANVSVNVSEARFRYTVAADSGRLIESTGTVQSTLTGQGQSVALEERFTLRFHGYGDPVSVTLPEAADTAVDIGNETAG